MLAVSGELRSAHDRSLTASIDHQRSVYVGGLYTVGAWKIIFDNVASDIAHDLSIHFKHGAEIAQGKAFVVSLPPRADVITSVAPPGTMVGTKIVPITDRRAETRRIGERHAAFGVSMGDVYFFRDVPQFVREALADELSAAGHRIVDTDENFLLTGELQKFWVYTETTALYWDIIGEIQLKLAIQKREIAASTTEREFACRVIERTYVWPSSTLVANLLGKCLEELMTSIRSDSAWKGSGPTWQSWKTKSHPS